MNSQIIHNRLLNEIKNAIPQKTKRTNMLAEILSIEKEAVYRRLRGEVPFTFHEVVLIANNFNISVDNIIRKTSEKSKPFHLKMSEYIDPLEFDSKMLKEYIAILETGQKGNSDVVEASNFLPQSILLNFDLISKLYYFKWNYFFNQFNQTFEHFHLPSKIKMLQEQTRIASKKVQKTTYIWDPLVIQFLVDDIIFIKQMNLINEKDIFHIKQELHNLLNYVEQIAQKGAFIETNNEVNIYISTVNLDTNYSYIETQKHRVSFIKVFILTGIASLDEKTFEKTKTWVQSLKRASTLISICGEKQRVLFFEKQRKLIDKL